VAQFILVGANKDLMVKAPAEDCGIELKENKRITLIQNASVKAKKTSLNINNIMKELY
jgi:hypothetical protein